MIKLLDSGAEERNRERGGWRGGEDRLKDGGTKHLYCSPQLGRSHLSPCPVELLAKTAGVTVLGAHVQLVGWKERAWQSHLAPIPPGSPALCA